MNDLLIRGARVYDGLGNPGRDADVAVRDGRIVPPGETSAPARKTVDAGGLALMPGIVDIHTHYDAQITWDRTLFSPLVAYVATPLIGLIAVNFPAVGHVLFGWWDNLQRLLQG